MPGGMGIKDDGTEGYLKLNGIICVTYNVSGIKGVVKTVNGTAPDSVGNIVLPTGTVKSVNGNAPDASGAATIPVASASAAGIMSATDKVKLDSVNVNGSGLGIGQTWQNVASTRALGTTYYNTTGKPISISVTCTGGGGSEMSITVSGIEVGRTRTSERNNSWYEFVGSLSAIIPDGASYSINSGAGSITVWSELR